MTGSLSISQASTPRAAHNLPQSGLPIPSPGSCSPKTGQRGKSSWSNDLPSFPYWGRCHCGCWFLLSWKERGTAQKTGSAGRRANLTLFPFEGRISTRSTESKTTQSLITSFLSHLPVSSLS